MSSKGSGRASSTRRPGRCSFRNARRNPDEKIMGIWVSAGANNEMIEGTRILLQMMTLRGRANDALNLREE